MLLLNQGLPEPHAVRQCVQEVFTVRGTHITPSRIGAPPLTWTASYSAMAKELILNETTLDEAAARLNDYWSTLF
jgi:hypothetical protein